MLFCVGGGGVSQNRLIKINNTLSMIEHGYTLSMIEHEGLNFVPETRFVPASFEKVPLILLTDDSQNKDHHV